MPRRTVAEQEERRIEVLNQALKKAIPKEFRENDTGLCEHMHW